MRLKLQTMSISELPVGSSRMNHRIVSKAVLPSKPALNVNANAYDTYLLMFTLHDASTPVKRDALAGSAGSAPRHCVTLRQKPDSAALRHASNCC